MAHRTPQKLGNTSALVLLLLQGEIYETKQAKTYLAKLELSAGQALYNRIMGFWQHYDEVIKNRKWIILKWIAEILGSAPAPAQIVIAAAGLDAMGIELAHRHPTTHIFELDIEHMEEKAKLAPHTNCSFIYADITKPSSALTALEKKGFNPKEKTLLLLEGISYYITPNHIQAFTQTLSPSFVIADICQKPHSLSPKARAIVDNCFGAILGEEQLSKMARYDKATLEQLLTMKATHHLTMKDIEHLRHKKNQHFPTTKDSWISLTLLKKN